MTGHGLFPEPERAVPAEQIDDTRTPEQRRRARQLAAIALGQHPLSVALGCSLPLHAAARRDGARTGDGSPRCGSCVLRGLTATNGHRSWPKCHAGSYQTSRALLPGEKATDPWVRADGRVTVTVHPRITHGAGTDVAAWWPACRDYQPSGGPSSSPSSERQAR